MGDLNADGKTDDKVGGYSVEVAKRNLNIPNASGIVTVRWPAIYLTSIDIDSQGRVYVGSWRGGLLRYDEAAAVPFVWDGAYDKGTMCEPGSTWCYHNLPAPRFMQ